MKYRFRFEISMIIIACVQQLLRNLFFDSILLTASDSVNTMEKVSRTITPGRILERQAEKVKREKMLTWDGKRARFSGTAK